MSDLMSKAEAMKAMIDGKRVVNVGIAKLHYFHFESGRFYYVADGASVEANLEHANKYTILKEMKTIRQVGFVTKACAESLKGIKGPNAPTNYVISPDKTSKSQIQISNPNHHLMARRGLR